MAMVKIARIKLPIQIDPAAVYTIEAANAALGLQVRCLPREIRLGRLAVAKRAGRYFFMGQWLLNWIQTGKQSVGETGRKAA